MPDIRGGLAAASCYILGVLWKYSLILGGVFPTVWTSLIQDTVLLGLLNLSFWSLLLYMFNFPESKLVTGLSRNLQYLGCTRASFLAKFLMIFGLWQLLFNGHATGTIWVALGCIMYIPLPGLAHFEVASAQAMNDYLAALRNGDPLPDVLQPDTAGGQVVDTDTDTSSELDIVDKADDSGESAEPEYILSLNSD